MNLRPAPTGRALRIVVLDDYQGAAERYGRWDLVPADIELDAVREHIDDVERLADRIGGADVVVAMRERTSIGPELLSRLPDLGLLVTTGPSNRVIDVAAAAERGILTCGTGGYLTPTSELTWALILAVARHLPDEFDSARRGGWQHTVGSELAGRTLGILGLGRLGQLVAGVGQAFGMDVIAWSQNLDRTRALELGVEPVDRDELFDRSDVLSVHLQLSDRTTGLVGAAELARMKSTAILVNTSRGPIVDEHALVDALRRGVIGGAGLDVFDVEPLPPEHPLRTLPNVALTPHIGYVTDGLYRVFYDDIVDDVIGWLAGEPRRPVSPPEQNLT